MKKLLISTTLAAACLVASPAPAAGKLPPPEKPEGARMSANRADNAPASGDKFHIFLLMGQSNMSGFGALEPGDEKPVPGVFVIPTVGKDAPAWQPAAHPLHNRIKSDRFGLGLPFALQYRNQHPGVQVGLIPVAWGGAGIDRLKKGTPVFADAMAKAKWAAQQGVIAGVLWHQGESDTVTAALAGAYAGKLDQLVKDVRAELGLPDLPFVAGQLADFYGTDPEHNAPARVAQIATVQTALRELPQRMAHTAWVSSAGLASIDGHNVHFDRASYIELGKRYAAAGIATTAPQPQPVSDGTKGALTPQRQSDMESLQRFADMRFGIMFHWGPAVLRNSEISWSMSNRAKYEEVYQKFNPKHFDADAWADVAKTAGGRYVIYVCKHHDGFCMWDTQTTDNNIMNTPFKRDVTGELAGACKRHELTFGTYLSIMDIHEAKWDRCYAARTDMPGYPEGLPHIEELTRQQTLELLKKYNSQFMWYDGAWLEGWRTSSCPKTVSAAIKSYNPKVPVTRLQNDVDDYECMEARIGAYRSNVWEMVTSVAYPTYSYNTRIKYKTTAYLVQTLSRVACGNGNLLLNFVPDVEGAIPGEQLEIAKEIGGWLKINGSAIYGTQGGPWYPGSWGGSTRNGKRLYVHLLPEAPESLLLPPCGAKALSARMLNGGTAKVAQTDVGLEISVPANARDPKVTVVELTVDSEVQGMIEASKKLTPVKRKSDDVPLPAEEREKAK